METSRLMPLRATELDSAPALGLGLHVSGPLESRQSDMQQSNIKRTMQGSVSLPKQLTHCRFYLIPVRFIFCSDPTQPCSVMV